MKKCLKSYQVISDLSSGGLLKLEYLCLTNYARIHADNDKDAELVFSPYPNFFPLLKKRVAQLSNIKKGYYISFLNFIAE